MISKKDILKMARDVFHRSQGYRERKIINPSREWFIIVSLFIVIVIAGSVINIQSYIYYNNLASVVNDTAKPVKKYKTETAKMATEIYTKKLNAFNKLLDFTNTNQINSSSTKSIDINFDSPVKATTTQDKNTLTVPPSLLR